MHRSIRPVPIVSGYYDGEFGRFECSPYPSKAVYTGEDIGKCNNSHSRAAFDGPCQVVISIDIGDRVTPASHNTSNHEVNNHAGHRAS
jgi:hypothetical protein